MSEMNDYLPFFIAAGQQPDVQRKSIAKTVSRASGVPHSTLLGLLRASDADKAMKTFWDYGVHPGRMDALLRNALRSDPYRRLYRDDLRQRSTRELPVTATGSLAWVALANEKVLVEVEAEGDRLQLLIDGVPDDLLELEVEGDGDQFLSTDGLLSDCCHEILESWKQRVQWALDDGWGEVVAVARDAGLEWSVTERDTQGEPVALWLFGRGRDIHWSKAWGWEVGDLRLPGGLSGAALQAAIAVARV